MSTNVTRIRPLIIIVFCVSLLSIQAMTSPVLSQVNEDPFFSITLVVPDNNPTRVAYSAIISHELGKIGIDARTRIVSFEEWKLRTIENPNYPAPLYEDNGFDLTMIGYINDNFEWLSAGGYLNSTAIVGAQADKGDLSGYDYYFPEFKTLSAKYFSEFDLTKKNELFNEMQQMLYRDLPIIGLFEGENIYIYNSGLDLTQKEAQLIQSGHGSNIWLDLDNSGKKNLTYTMKRVPLGVSPRISAPGDKEYEGYNEFTNNMVFQGLYDRDIENPKHWVPVIASQSPIWNSEHTIATIKLHENVTFMDGIPLTGKDVVESYRIYLNPNGLLTQVPYFVDSGIAAFLNPYLSNDSIVEIDDHTVEFDFLQPTATAMESLSFPILPILHWENYTNQEIPLVKEELFLFMNSTGTAPFLYGSGSMNYTDISLEDGSEQFTRIEVHWSGKNSEIKTIEGLDSDRYFDGIADIVQSIENGSLDLFVPFLQTPDFFENYELFENNPEVKFTRVSTFTFQMVFPNFAHPILGTGLDTPLGQKSSENASDAARFIRHAISKIIPRRDMINEYLFGLGKPLTIPVLSTQTDDTFDHLMDTYDLEAAKDYMRMAGYVFAEDYTFTSFEKSTKSDTNLIFLSLPTIIITYMIILNRKQRFLIEN